MFETSLEEDEIVISVTFPFRKSTYYLKTSSQASKYAIVGVFGSFFEGKLSVSITGAANKVFSLDQISNMSSEELKSFDFTDLDLSKLDINNDLHASATYRESLIRSLLSKLISIML